MVINLNASLQLANIDFTMFEKELEWLARQAHLHKIIVEVGSWKGCSTRALTDNTSGVVYAVDTWAGTDWNCYKEILKDKEPGWLFSQFLANMEDVPKGKFITVHMLSVDAAAYFKKNKVQPDMVFIDATHDYKNVKADILAWKPLIAPGGLLCGHDYCKEWPGVSQAVRELIPHHHSGPKRIWYTHV